MIFGGVSAVDNIWRTIFDVFATFFPFIGKAGKTVLEDYLTAPYFIVGVIMVICSAFGIWFGAKGGKVLFLIVSIICEVASLVSIFANVL